MAKKASATAKTAKPLRGEVCILSGGKSRRMGSDKSKVRLAGVRMIDWVQDLARPLGWYLRAPEEDLQPGHGPISGIETALAGTKADAVIFLSIDQPLLPPACLDMLRSQLEADDLAVFTHLDGWAGFPLIIRRKALKLVRQQMAQGEFSIQSLAQALKAKTLRPPQSLANRFTNLNTPEQLVLTEKWFTQEGPGSAVVEVESLGVRRGSTEILKGVDWRVNPGEHWVILGANGSGKTTLLGALTGYMTPTTGLMWVMGRQYGHAIWPELRKTIGLVSSSIRQMMADSEPALHTVASGKYAVIDSWGTPQRTDLGEAAKWLDLVGCSYLAERVWAVLSQGERQRVLIARALMASPRLLILDEPCTGLDPVARAQFLNFLNGLGETKQGPSLVLVTHHVEEITPVFTHVLMLHEGSVLAAGPRDSVMKSDLLSQAFGAEVKLRSTSKGYSLEMID